MNDTQFQIDHLIELAVLQRAELKQLVDSMPQLRDHLSEEIERNLEEAEPAIRSELEQLVIARATDEHAKISVALTAKIDELAKALEITTAAKYSVLMAERAENVNLLAKAEARIEDAASMLTHAVKEIVTDELSRFPRAGEIDQLRKEFAEPRGLNPRGRWMPDETYQRLDLVTINGDSFVSNIDGNRERPSRTAGDWTLSAARGNGGGGGGVTSMTDLVPVPSNGQLLIGNGSAFVNSTLTAGTGISISNGAGSITINATDGNITLDDGTAAAPSLNFTNEPTTGLFRASANVMGFAVNGVSRATMTTTGVTVTGTITPTGSVHAAAGSVGNPSLAFDADQDTGLFRIGANNLGVAAGGAKVLDVATTGLGVTGTLSVSGVATLGAGAILNTPASATLTNATGLPISTGVSGLGANVATFLATPSSANLAAALTDETGTGALVFATSPTLTTPISASLTSPAATNLTLGLGTGGTALTLESSTLAATFAGSIKGSAAANYFGGTTAPAVPVAVVTQSPGGNLFPGLGITSAGGSATKYWNLFAANVYTDSDLFFVPNSTALASAVLRISNGGVVTLSNSTAGSSGAGALVVTGGASFGSTVDNTVSTVDRGINILQTRGGANTANYGIVSIVTGAATGTGVNTAAYFQATGATTNYGLRVAGGKVLVDDATASSSATTGAVQIGGGIGVGAASYFGGAVSIVTTNVANPFIINSTSANIATAYQLAGVTKLILGVSAASNGVITGSVLGDPTFRTAGNILFSTDDGTTVALKLAATTGAATFAGAVTVGGTGFLSAARSVYTTGALATPVANSAVMDWSGGYARFWGVGENASTAGGLKLVVAATDASPFVEALTIEATGAATFGGTVTAGNTIQATAALNQLYLVSSAGTGLSSSHLISFFDSTGSSRQAYIYKEGTSGKFVIGNDQAGKSIVLAPSGSDAVTVTSTAATFAGTVIAPAATASLAPLRIPHGTAPTSPTDGDMWSTTAGLFIRINGVTKTVTLT